MAGMTKIARTVTTVGLLSTFTLCSFGCSLAGPSYSTIEVGPLTMEYPAEYTAMPVPAEKGSWTTSTGLSYDETSTSMVNDEQTVLYTVNFYEGVSFEYALDRAVSEPQGTQNGGIDENEFAERWHTDVFEKISNVSIQEPVMTEIDGHRAFSREGTWKASGTNALARTLCIEVDECSIAVVAATFTSVKGAENDVAMFAQACNSIEIEG